MRIVTILFLLLSIQWNGYTQVEQLLLSPCLENNEVRELWFDLDNQSLLAISNDQYCILKNDNCDCQPLDENISFIFDTQTCDRFIPSPVFTTKYGHIYSFKDQKFSLIDEQKFPNSAAYKTDSILWIAQKQIFKISKDTVLKVDVFTTNDFPFWDIRPGANNQLWFSNFGAGAYRLKKDDVTFERYSEVNDLRSNKVSGISVRENTAIIGQPGFLSRLKNGVLNKNLNLAKYIGKDPILEIEQDDNNRIFVLTKSTILSIEDFSKHKIDVLPIPEDIEVFCIEYSPEQGLLMGTNRGIARQSTINKKISKSMRNPNASMYYFGEELLYSNTARVDQVLDNNNLVKSDYRLVEKAVRDQSGADWVIDKNSCILLDPSKSEVIKKCPKPSDNINDILNLNTNVILAFEEGLSLWNGQEMNVLSNQESFYKILKYEEDIFTLSNKGLQQLVDLDSLEYIQNIPDSDQATLSGSIYHKTLHVILIPLKEGILIFDPKTKQSKTLDLDIKNPRYLNQYKEHILVGNQQKLQRLTLDSEFNLQTIKKIHLDGSDIYSLFIDRQDKLYVQGKKTSQIFSLNDPSIYQLIYSNSKSDQITIQNKNNFTDDDHVSDSNLTTDNNEVETAKKSSPIKWWMWLLGVLFLLICLIIWLIRLVS